MFLVFFQEIGTGAVILQLDNPLKLQHDYSHKSKRCEIHLKAPPHFGIMVTVAFLMNGRMSLFCEYFE
jgi:hypothetical protein